MLNILDFKTFGNFFNSKVWNPTPCTLKRWMFQPVVDLVSPSGSHTAVRPELMLRWVTGVPNAKHYWCWLVAERGGECGVSAPRAVTTQRSNQNLPCVFRLGSLGAAVLGKRPIARLCTLTQCMCTLCTPTYEIPENSACFASSLDHLLKNFELTSHPGQTWPGGGAIFLLICDVLTPDLSRCFRRFN